MHKRTFRCIWMIMLTCIVFGCSLPKIILLEDPLTPEEHLNLGVAYEKNGELEEALKEYKKASKSLPVADFYIGNIHFLKAEYEVAENYYKKALKRDGNVADAYNNLAWIYYIEKKNLDTAEDYAKKAIRLNPSKSSDYEDTLKKIRKLKGCNE